MKVLEDTIIADEGKVIMRIADNTIYGKEVLLGYCYYIGGHPLTAPHKDTVEDFTEIDEPSEYEDVTQIEVLTDLEKSIIEKRKEIKLYDSSLEVNEFFVNGVSCWIDKATRVGLVNSTKMEIEIGREETTLILNDMVLNLSCHVILEVLARLEVYAKDCYNVTARHLINVNNLTSVEEVNSYDYKVGYPMKLNIEV